MTEVQASRCQELTKLQAAIRPACCRMWRAYDREKAVLKREAICHSSRTSTSVVVEPACEVEEAGLAVGLAVEEQGGLDVGLCSTVRVKLRAGHFRYF